MKKSRVFLALGLAASIICSSAFPVMAVDEQDIEAVNSTISDLETQKADLLGEIDSLDQQLVVTIASISSLDEQIPVKDEAIKDSEKSYKNAVTVRDVEYEAMKKRIQYLYENGGEIGWATLLLEDKNITDFLNAAEYTQQMYQYDRECLEHYAQIVTNVQNLKTVLESEKAELVSMRSENELQKQYLESLLDEKRATSTDYDNQIAALTATAEEYRAIIDEQNRAMQELAAQQYAASMANVDTSEADAAAAQAAEAQAAAQAAAEAEAAAQAAAEAAAAEAASQAEQGVDPAAEAAAAQAAAEAAAAQAAAEAEAAAAAQAAAEAEAAAAAAQAAAEAEAAAAAQAEAEAAQQGGEQSGGGLGQEVVNWALQWVGVTPYVWAGNSLTAGTDCSGFVHLVYANFGIYVPRGSYDCRFCGYEVPYSEAQPGDIICYDGHVAMYIGGGAIVHASDEATGTKISYDATYRPILTVRRVI